MADMSRVNEKLQTLAQKVDELLSRPQGAVDGGNAQAEVDQIEQRLDEILARIP
jgi:tetrahydromethanopterin S-methyltransferase subunit G